MKKLDDNISRELEIKIKELLELINKKSENELILRDFEVNSSVSLCDSNILNTKYNILFSTLLAEK